MSKNVSKIAFFVAAILWGASYAIQKPLLDSIDPVSFTFWNFFLSGILFFGYALYARLPLLYRFREGLILGVFLCSMEILEMVGLKFTTSANTVFLTNLGMLIIPFVGWLFFKDKVKVVDSVAVFIAIFGMYLLVGGLSGFGVGEGVLVISALSSAFYFIYSERFEAEKAHHITTLCVQQFFVISFISFVWGSFSGISFSVPEGLKIELLWQVLLFTTIPYAIIQWASRYADEMIAVLYDGIVEPLTGAILAWVIIKEPSTPLQVLGGMLMILAFVFSSLINERHFLYRKVLGFFRKH